jgi:Tfp pilus assembly protein PilW
VRKPSGFNILELVISLALIIVVLGIVSSYLVQESNLSRRTQARNEVQDRVRIVMQLVRQDLQQAGSSRFIDASTLDVNATVSGWTSCTSTSPCLTGTNNGNQDSFTVRYITSLKSVGVSCRQVTYSFASGSNDLQRTDAEGCSGTPTPVVIASDILAMNIQYQCGMNTTDQDTPNCGTNSFTRSAVVTIMGQSEVNVGATDDSTWLVACPSNKTCFQLREEVLLPSLKTQ